MEMSTSQHLTISTSHHPSYLIFNVIMVIAARIIVVIQKRTVIFDSWNAPFGRVMRYLQSGSSCEACVRKLSWIGVRLKMRCLTPRRLPSL